MIMACRGSTPMRLREQFTRSAIWHQLHVSLTPIDDLPKLSGKLVQTDSSDTRSDQRHIESSATAANASKSD